MRCPWLLRGPTVMFCGREVDVSDGFPSADRSVLFCVVTDPSLLCPVPVPFSAACPAHSRSSAMTEVMARGPLPHLTGDRPERTWLAGTAWPAGVAQGHPPESRPPPRERSCELGTSPSLPPGGRSPRCFLKPGCREPWRRGNAGSAASLAWSRCSSSRWKHTRETCSSRGGSSARDAGLWTPPRVENSYEGLGLPPPFEQDGWENGVGVMLKAGWSAVWFLGSREQKLKGQQTAGS